jgi:hypothetical protein
MIPFIFSHLFCLIIYIMHFYKTISGFIYKTTIYIENNDEVNECELMNAVVINKNNKKLYTFDDAQKYIDLGHIVKITYKFQNRKYKIVYNPNKKPLPGNKIALCPPHVNSWTIPDHDPIIIANITFYKSDGSHIIIDVSNQINLVFGPLCDFHKTAGGTLGCYSFVDDIPDDVISASLVYYDGDGNEFTLRLPTIAHTDFLSPDTLTDHNVPEKPDTRILQSVASKLKIKTPRLETTDYNGFHFRNKLLKKNINKKISSYKTKNANKHCVLI